MTARRVALPLLLFAGLWMFVDVPAVLGRVRHVGPGWLAAGLLLVQLQVVLSALRWRLTAGRLGHHIGPARAIGEYYLATLLNQVLPGGVAGDAARALRGKASSDVALADVARGVVVERLAGQLSLLLVTLGGLALWPWLVKVPPPRAALVALAGVFTLAVVAWGALVVVARVAAPRWRRAVAGIGPTLRRCWLDDGAWLVQGAASLVVTATYLGVFAVSAAATGAPLPAFAITTIVPLTLASMLLPISVGGWGVREAAAAVLWPLAGLAAEEGVAASVLYGLISLVGSLPGLFASVRPVRLAREGSKPDT